MYLIAIVLWGGLCWVIARSAGRLVGRWISYRWLPQALTWVMTPLLFISPLADEIIARPQYERLCESAREVRIYATHPVGEELYTPDGKWRRSDDREESNRLTAIYESLVRWDSYNEEIPAAVFSISKRHTRIYDKDNGRLLAEWDAYNTSGGWVGRQLGGPVLMKPYCMPDQIHTNVIYPLVLPFNKEIGDVK